ncbi:hypothetical protein VNO77_16737 [Canavalia gladiata]|uniref:Uncharacterized protein n=1 Tax=Canavalia gladiata TaxID=3824 RepID=A0AAN9LMJ8_CANGL
MYKVVPLVTQNKYFGTKEYKEEALKLLRDLDGGMGKKTNLTHFTRKAYITALLEYFGPLVTTVRDLKT